MLGHQHDLRSIARIDLSHDVADVHFDGAFAHAEFESDRFVLLAPAARFRAPAVHAARDRLRSLLRLPVETTTSVEFPAKREERMSTRVCTQLGIPGWLGM